MAEYRHLGVPDKEWKDFPQNLPLGTKIHKMARDRLPIENEIGLDIQELDVVVRDESPIRVRWYRAASTSKALPVFIYMHGGGYVTGGLETDDVSCRAVARQVDVLILSIEYRLAPEHKFPTGLQDCQDVIRWVVSQDGQQRLNIDPSQGFLVGGTSAGGNFTAGLSHILRDEHIEPSITGLLFLAPNFCHPDARPHQYLNRILSVDEVDDAPGLTRQSINFFAGKYGGSPTDERLSPLLFKSHANQARKAFFAVCGWDPRRDEALLYEQILRSKGVNTKLHVYAGLPHGFWTTCPDLPVSKSWQEDMVKGVAWLLEI